jgi:hypothetical protein
MLATAVVRVDRSSSAHGAMAARSSREMLMCLIEVSPALDSGLGNWHATRMRSNRALDPTDRLAASA